MPARLWTRLTTGSTLTKTMVLPAYRRRPSLQSQQRKQSEACPQLLGEWAELSVNTPCPPCWQSTLRLTPCRSTKPTPPPPAVLKRTEHFDDDSALDNALSDDFDDDDAGFSSINLADQLSKIETAPPQDVPPREGLYSTPLSWERPQPAIRPESFHGLQSPYLSEAEQRRLIAIAMTPGPSTGGLGSSMNFNFGGLGAGMGSFLGSGFGSSDTAAEGPKPVSPPQAAAALHSKKKGSVSEKAKEALKSGERTAHNDIERKYRTNLKDKIAELRDAVPALRTISEDGGEDDGAQPSKTAKLSKVRLMHLQT